MNDVTLMVAIPTIDGKIHAQTVHPLFFLKERVESLGWNFELSFLASESLIPRARNHYGQMVLQNPDITHLFFLDSDIVIADVDAIVEMIQADKELIVGAYPFKKMDFNEDGSTSFDYVFRGFVKDGGGSVNDIVFGRDQVDPIKVEYGATGCMLIKRSVFEKLRENEKVLSYSNNSVKSEFFQQKMYAFFDTSVEDDEYLSEDYFFCRRWTEMGGDIWLAPWVRLGHIGQFVYGY